MNEEIIYSCKAPNEATNKEATVSFAVITILAAILFVAASHAPYSGILTLAVLFFFAIGIYSVMKRSVFDITYVLYSDRLVYMRRYGTVVKENEVFPFDESVFADGKITFRSKDYPFHPDKKLKELLNII
ncbi:MAG: hypothetical protein LUG52_01850 [Clostridia bacterium]|nr:hypothetical protein [Clostridia bacterium]